ncbi:hypothetical protein Tsubulata_041552 [Turnera subulata]|uniref:F-box domain-containing protein n=1 Tax=Turnera subulata TaxID=218843 RepID=A0A9Q0G247_9ROSI|nr:hypothetical protein Tsubulata_041552 [Turnera subulata]
MFNFTSGFSFLGFEKASGIARFRNNSVKMDTGVDFLNLLDYDVSVKILTCLEDPSDLARASAVSRSWRNFVIASGLCKQLCLRMFPLLRRVDCVIEPRSEVGCSKSVEWEKLETEHRAYAFLAHSCTSFPLRDCLSDALCASSTDNYPEESVRNTLLPGDRVARSASYWSSTGQSNPAVPETLVYKLLADICVITEIYVQPFQAYFQWGLPIYSAKAVRFRMGHPKAPMGDMPEPFDGCADDKYVWTYTSPEFPMSQESQLQKFKLPEPVLCVGGVLLVELLGRVQRQEMDGLYYICVSHVKVVGRPLSNVFAAEISEPSGKFALRAISYTPPIQKVDEDKQDPVPGRQRRIRDLEQIVNMLRERGVQIGEYIWDGEEDEEDDESDEDFVL